MTPCARHFPVQPPRGRTVIMFSTIDLTVRKHATCFRPPFQTTKRTIVVFFVRTTLRSMLMCLIDCADERGPSRAVDAPS